MTHPMSVGVRIPLLLAYLIVSLASCHVLFFSLKGKQKGMLSAIRHFPYAKTGKCVGRR